MTIKLNMLPVMALQRAQIYTHIDRNFKQHRTHMYHQYQTNNNNNIHIYMNVYHKYTFEQNVLKLLKYRTVLTKMTASKTRLNIIFLFYDISPRKNCENSFENEANATCKNISPFKHWKSCAQCTQKMISLIFFLLLLFLMMIFLNVIFKKHLIFHEMEETRLTPDTHKHNLFIRVHFNWKLSSLSEFNNTETGCSKGLK